MKLRIDECQGLVCGILNDLSRYDSVDRWLSAIVSGTAEFIPLDLYLKFNGKGARLLQSGEFCDGHTALIDVVRRLPADVRHIPNDNMVIIADAFERELTIDLDGDMTV